MKRIIIFNKMFVSTRRITVIEDNNIVEDVIATPEALIETVFSLADRYDIDTVEIKGSKVFSKGLEKDLTQAMGTTKYSRKLNISII